MVQAIGSDRPFRTVMVVRHRIFVQQLKPVYHHQSMRNMKINTAIVEASASHVTKQFSEQLDKNFLYHNLSHTIFVVNSVEKICDALAIAKHPKKILLVAAWFHDLGYTQQVDNHEKAGADQAAAFLQLAGIDEEDINLVKTYILATRYPQQPATLMEEIICDADMMHIGEKSFWQTATLLRKEWELTKEVTCSDADWLQSNIDFLNAHRFHTGYCKDRLSSKKEKLTRKLQRQLSRIVENTGNNDNRSVAVNNALINRKLERGVETLFRSASGNHMRLSGMADNKAHILLSINSVIISIILSVLAKKLTAATYLIVPTILLLSTAAVSIVFAVLTTKPKVSKGVFTIDQINKREVNLLFFGNFHQMDLDTYEWGIREMMYDKDYLYKSMTKDIYFLGKVLARKYRFLNIGYRVFMYGLLASVLAFGISFLLAAPAS